ncbi:MAG: SPFH/Band 7/PHB domain protein [Gammaproteobacteria bacterium]|nr:SPFH/Band 7/PHB domain protein [Gammaproteobacteria bacterium]
MWDYFVFLGSAGIVILSIVLSYIFLAVKQVPQGYEWTVERFGRYTKTLQPGLHFIVPLVDHIGFKICMKEEVLDIPSQEVISKDNAMIQVDGVAFYQVMDAARAAYEVNYLVHAIRNLVMTNIRTVLGSLDLDEQLSHRDKINTKLLAVVDEAVSPWGIKITRIEIKDIRPPDDLVAAMGRQMKAEREKRANVLEAEGFRQSAILKAEGEKQAVILEAEASKEAAYRESEARERRAEAEAKATEVVSTAIARGDQKAIQYFVAQQYIKAMSDIGTAPNQKVIMMPWEASNVIGALSGVTELLNDLKTGKDKK